MITHVVCFKIKEEYKNRIEEAKNTLLSMDGKVKELKAIKVGVDFLHSDRSYDLILIVQVKDKDALNAYQKDDYHCSVVKPLMHEIRSNSVAVDFEE